GAGQAAVAVPPGQRGRPLRAPRPQPGRGAGGPGGALRADAAPARGAAVNRAEVDLPGPALLFCPADRPDRYAKAAERADAVVLDLEDGVAAEHKDRARALLVAGLADLDPDRVVVRVNAPGSPWWDAD